MCPLPFCIQPVLRRFMNRTICDQLVQSLIGWGETRGNLLMELRETDKRIQDASLREKWFLDVLAKLTPKEESESRKIWGHAYWHSLLSDKKGLEYKRSAIHRELENIRLETQRIVAWL